MNPAVAPSPLAVDLMVFTVTEADLKVLLTRRQAPPFRDSWCLPGDAVDLGDMGRHPGEHLSAAARRVLETCTGLPEQGDTLAQVGAWGRAGRDPRGRVVSVAWATRLRPDLAPVVGTRPGSDWFSVGQEVPWMRLALDHAEILAAGVEHLRQEAPDPISLLQLVPAAFTVSDLEQAEAAILDRPVDPRSFRRRFQRWVGEGLIQAAPGRRHMGRARPARVWRATCRISGHTSLQDAG